MCVYFLSLAYSLRHFRYLRVFRPSRAFTGLFTTRLAKMADAQVCSGKRRGEFKSLYLQLNEHIQLAVLSIRLHILVIRDHEPFQTTFRL